jgi:hypothetical protein
MAILAVFLLFGWPHAKPSKSPREIAAEKVRTEAMARVRAEADAGKIAPDDVSSEMEFQGELAYREALNADDTRPTYQQIAAWSSALHYKVLNLTREPGLSCTEKVEFDKPQEKPELETICESIRQHECAGVTPIILNFYLRDMNEDGDSWASAHFEPSAADPKPHFSITISGMTPDRESSVNNPAQKAGEEIIGSWRDPSDGFLSTIVKKNGRYYEDFSVEDPDHPIRNSLEQAPSPQGRKFVVTESGTGEYYLIAPDGNLKEYDRTGYIKTIPKAPK